MSLLIISGSQRSGSESLRVARFVQRAWAGVLANDQTPAAVINLAEMRASWWYDAGGTATPEQAALKAAAKVCTGLVCVTPEWNGMAPPIVNNFFLLMNEFELAHKPGYIVSVSGGMGGAYPIQELRMGSYKNSKICWIPEHLILRDVAELNCTHPIAAAD